MDIEDIKNLFTERKINKVKVSGFDIDGILRGKYISLDKFFSAAEGGFGFCDVVFGWDSSDVLYDKSVITGWHTGYPDALAKIDLSTLRIVPWEPNTALFLVDFHKTDGSPLEVSPRQLLRNVIKKANEMGFQPFMSSEYEYFLFRETPHSLHEKGFKNLTPLAPGMFGYSILRASTASELIHKVIDGMREYDVELEGFHTETGPGAYETAIKYDNALRAADKSALFKTGVKEIAARMEIVATFMAKISPNLSGCGGHLHQSLWDMEEKTNLFYDEADERKMSKIMKHYIAGQVETMPEFAVFSCPTVNSYKRIAPGTLAWAPTNASWGIENRTTGVRAIVGQSPKSTRIEYRLTGADANPYIAMAASLAAGLYGIENEINPGEPFNQNAYVTSAGKFRPMPRSLEEAIELLKQSNIARKYLGDEFVAHFIITREWEVRQFRKAVTDWELQRYFEII
ncbi:glutamine synthetase [Candidatus Poribacteria bacterium]|nr:glutamine synthetase [Candidatus Poribacteria bacterium]